MQKRCGAERDAKTVPSELAFREPMEFRVKCSEECSRSATITLFRRSDKRRKRGFHVSLDFPDGRPKSLATPLNRQYALRAITYLRGFLNR